MLTGLNNRRHFFELAELELTRAGRHGKPFSLLMLDWTISNPLTTPTDITSAMWH